MATLPLTEKGRLNFLTRLPGKIWKLLPLYEQDDNYKIYLKRLLEDINSANDLFDGEFADIIVKLNVVYLNELEHEDAKSRILDCRSLADKIRIKEESDNGLL